MFFKRMAGIIIATHNGKFHADESLAIAILTRLNQFKGAKIVRTRDSEILKSATIVVDVGGEYDSSRNLFDHHQPSFHDTFSPKHRTRLSSAGLIYKHFGITLLIEKYKVDEKDAVVLHERIYERFIEAFDGVDNGVERFETSSQPLYHKMCDFADMVNDLNPLNSEENPDEQFQKAVELVGNQLDRFIMNQITWWLPARPLILQAFDSNSSNERFLVFTEPFAWREHLFSLEAERNMQNHYLYVVYPDSTSGTYRIQAVPVQEGSFESRLPLPETWRGLRDAELDKITGVEGGIFVHVNGFIGGHKTLSGAIKLVQNAINISENN